MSTDARICGACGIRADAHRGSGQHCPATERFPRMAKLPLNATLERIELAEKAWDKRIARHWSKRTTSFTRQD